MIFMRLSALLCLLLCLPTLSRAGTDEAERLFQKGNTEASQKQYEAAISSFGQALGYGSSPALHYNLANTYREAGMNGSAVLHYERALLLDSTLSEARQNLSLLRVRQGLPESSLNFLEKAGAVLPARSWAILLAVAFWTALATLLLPRFFGGRRTWHNLVLFAAFLSVVASGIGLFGWNALGQRAVVLDQPAPLRLNPAKDSLSNGSLSVGDFVRIERVTPDYFLVRSSRGQPGWVHRSEIAQLIE